MQVLSPTDQLPLTCTRLGVCCHGHQIWVNPWEVAELARGLGIAVREVRQRHLDCRGTRLAFDGPADSRGKHACRLYDPQRGCTVHPHRPLTCRMYPLGRARVDGEVRYYHNDDNAGGFPCLELCPTVTSLPAQQVGAYLDGQAIGAGEIAHDAYARVVYGLAAVAGRIRDLGKDEVDVARLTEVLDRCALLDAPARSELLPDGWLDLATAPALDATDPASFASGHGALITAKIQQAAAATDAGLTEAAMLHLLIAIHLAPAVGADLSAIRGLVLGT